MTHNPSQITLAQLLGRARMLARLNSRNVNERYNPDYRRWARLAFEEAKAGKTEHWTPPARLAVLKDRLADLQGRPLGQCVAADIRAVKDEIRKLEKAA